MITIWGRANSTNVKKVVWCAEECGLQWDRVDVGGPFGGLDDPSFRALNPLGLIPVIKDEDLILTESNAIVRYLAARYGSEMLFPAEPGARAKADAWMDWTQTSLMKPLFTLVVGLFRTPPEQRDQVAIDDARSIALGLCNQLEASLSRNSYLSGEHLGIGDISAGCAIHILIKLEIARSPAILDWYTRLLDRPAYREHVAIELS